MPKMVDYQCESETCEYETEELFGDTEEQPSFLEEKCPSCGGRLARARNLKNNCQRWKFQDQGGI